jgi:hypothetical protein
MPPPARIARRRPKHYPPGSHASAYGSVGPLWAGTEADENSQGEERIYFGNADILIRRGRFPLSERSEGV